MFNKDIWNWQLHLLTILSLMGFTVWTEPPQEFLLPGTADDSGTKKLSAQILLVLNKHWTPTTQADTWGKVKKMG